MFRSGLRFNFPRVLAIAILVAIPAIFPHSLDLFTIALLYWVMAMGLNLVVGECGLLDLGFAGFVCVGAYASAVAMTRFGLGYCSAVPIAVTLAGASGFVFGLPVLRLRGDYFAILSYGFAELIVLLVRNWPSLTGGPFGLGGIGDPVFLGYPLTRFPPRDYYLFVLASGTAVTAVMLVFRRTYLRAQMLVSRDDEVVSLAVGIDVTAVRMFGLTASAMIGGFAGSIWAVYFKFLSHADFTLILSILVLIVVVVGGKRTPLHLLASAILVAPLSEILRRWLRDLQLPEESRMALYGLVLVVFAVVNGNEGMRNAVASLRRVLRLGARPERSQVEDRAVRGHDRGSFAGAPVKLVEMDSRIHFAVERVNVMISGQAILSDICFSIRGGEALAVVGANGSGKTTLFNAISGFIPSTGAIALGTRRLDLEPSWDRGRLAVARTFQQSRLCEGLDVDVVKWLSNRPPARSFSLRIREILAACRLRRDDTGTIGTTPSQEFLAFCSGNPVVMLDEPIPGRSQAEISKILSSISAHKAMGGVVLIVEHDLKPVLPVIDHVLVLDAGRVSSYGSKELFLHNRRPKDIQ